MKRVMRLIALVLFVSFCIIAALNTNEDKTISSYTGDMTNKYLYLTFSKVLVKGTERTDSFIADSVSKAAENEDIVSEKIDSTNPYALYKETFSGAYLYDIYEANKGSNADGDWFIDDSERFTYYEVYDPLNNENLNIEWEIELSEMKETNQLARTVNEYHAELFEGQKKKMQEEQQKIMSMEVDDLDYYWAQYSSNIHTMASFEWGNIFTVVDMKDTHYRGCSAVVANFNKVSGKKYDIDDLFDTEDYKDKLLEIIKQESDGYDDGWERSLKSDTFSVMIGYCGLLLIDKYPARTFFIEWDKLKDILSKEAYSELEIDKGWQKLGSPEKAISYYFFSNAIQWHYNLNIEMCAAEVICAYAEDDSEEGTWELRSMHTRYTENYRRVLSFFACSEDGRELYMILDETHEAGPEYLVMADVMVDNDGSYSYKSSLQWKSYQDDTDSSEKYSGYSIYIDGNAYIYDSVYIDEGVNAMTDYLVSVQADKNVSWRMLEDLIYIGKNGYLADLWFSNGFQRVHMMVDIRDKQYSVVEVYDTKDESDVAIDSQVKITWDDLYFEGGAEADFFINASQWHYNPQLEKAAACAVKDYAKKIGLEDEEWKLTHMYSENGVVGVFARAKLYRRLSLLLKGNTYQVIADVQEGDGAEYELSDGFSYNSEMEWNSYYEWAMGEKENISVYTVHSDSEYYQHDSIYVYQLNWAMQAYLTSVNADKEETWDMIHERLFVGSQGSLADAWYTNGNRRVHLVVDVWNRMYTVI